MCYSGSPSRSLRWCFLVRFGMKPTLPTPKTRSGSCSGVRPTGVEHMSKYGLFEDHRELGGVGQCCTWHVRVLFFHGCQQGHGRQVCNWYSTQCRNKDHTAGELPKGSKRAQARRTPTKGRRTQVTETWRWGSRLRAPLQTRDIKHRMPKVPYSLLIGRRQPPS